MSAQYADFLEQKTQLSGDFGFDPDNLPDFLFDFQKSLVEWSLRKGRAAIFASCGLGKTPMQLTWAEQVANKTGKPVLIATPLAVSHQFIREAEKFGVNDVARIQDGDIPSGTKIVVTNYERIGRFNPHDFAGMVCDESSALKNFNGTRRIEVTQFMRKLPYRLLGTATAAPNDFIELGTSSEALGDLGHMDMLNRFFSNDNNTSDTQIKWRTQRGGPERSQWRFKGHSEDSFWRWVSSWARATRKPSDLGFDDAAFMLPPLLEVEHLVAANKPREDRLFDLPAKGLFEEREERRRTINERCAKVAELVDTSEQALVWCHLNDEGDLLSKLIPDAEQVKGSDSDELKESRLLDFAEGRLRVLVTKPKIGAWGLNLQNCNHVTFFPSHSYEQYFQGVRRCWRFGQTRPVTVDLVATEGELGVKKNLQRKAAQAERMFDQLIKFMNDAQHVGANSYSTVKPEVPSWM